MKCEQLGYMHIFNNETNKFEFKVGNNIVHSNEYSIEENKWYILGYTYDQSKVSFYIDGKKISTINLSGNISTNESFKKALLATGNATLTHSIGKTQQSTTVLTRSEFCSRLTKIRTELQKQ